MSDLTGLVFNQTVFYHTTNHHFMNLASEQHLLPDDELLVKQQHQQVSALDRIWVDVMCQFKWNIRIVSLSVGCSTDILI